MRRLPGPPTQKEMFRSVLTQKSTGYKKYSLNQTTKDKWNNPVGSNKPLGTYVNPGDEIRVDYKSPGPGTIVTATLRAYTNDFSSPLVIMELPVPAYDINTHVSTVYTWSWPNTDHDRLFFRIDASVTDSNGTEIHHYPYLYNPTKQTTDEFQQYFSFQQNPHSQPTPGITGAVGGATGSSP